MQDCHEAVALELVERWELQGYLHWALEEILKARWMVCLDVPSRRLLNPIAYFQVMLDIFAGRQFLHVDKKYSKTKNMFFGTLVESRG